MKLPNLEELTLVGCSGIDDEALGSDKTDCSKSLKVIILIGHFDFLQKNRPF
jgi:F-box and leucine-rich repeat protein 2/20